MFVIPENIVYWISTWNSSAPLYVGFAHGQLLLLPRAASGEAAYVLNKQALVRTRDLSIPGCQQYIRVQSKSTSLEDAFVAQCMSAAGVHFTRSTRFLPFNWRELVNTIGVERRPVQDFTFPCSFRTLANDNLSVLDDAFRKAVVQVDLV